MKNFNALTILLFLTLSMVACNETANEANDTDQTEPTSENSSSDEDSSSDDADKPQTVEERIAEIKKWYANIQKSPKQTKDCVTKSKTTIDYNIVEEGIPFENTAKKCSLEDDLSYQQVTLTGYEWGGKANFYYKNDQLFFAFVMGGAEAYGYEYRVYYDNKGEIIRVLLSENDYDGDEVGSPFEVKDETRKKEILNSIENARKEIRVIFGEK